MNTRTPQTALHVALGSGVQFARTTPSDARQEVVEALRSFVSERLREAFSTTTFSLRDRRQTADEDDDAPELEVWLYCSWADGPSITAVRDVIESCTRVEVTSPIPGITFQPGALVHVGYGCRGRSRAGWFALIGGVSAGVWESFEGWARTEGYRPHTALGALLREAEREVWERGYATPAPEDQRALEEGLDFSHCGARAWEVARIADALHPEGPAEEGGYLDLDAWIEWFVLEGRELAEAVLADCSEAAPA